jgi:hypothetical protein
VRFAPNVVPNIAMFPEKVRDVIIVMIRGIKEVKLAGFWKNYRKREGRDFKKHYYEKIGKRSAKSTSGSIKG